MNDNSNESLPESRVAEGCLSDLTLDRLRRADLPEPNAAEVQRHLERCVRCRGRAERLNARTRRVRWWAPVLGALLAGAALASFLSRPARPDAGRLEGATGELDVFVKRAGKVFRWQAEPLMPGDQLRYSFRAPEPMHVMVLSREANGVVNQYFPAEPSSFAVDMGVTLSKNTTELDGTLGGETLWAVFCQQSFEARTFQRELETQGRIVSTKGCATQRFEFTKVTP